MLRIPSRPSTPPSKLAAAAIDDPVLIEACRQGDRRALSQLYALHAPHVEQLLTRLLGPTADVDDALQQTLIAATQAFDRFRGEASVRTWLGRIAVHQAYALLRQPERRRRVPLSLVSEQLQATVAGVDREHEAKRTLARLYELLNQISPKQRVAFVLHVIEGHSIDEITVLMNAGAAATKSRVMWARRQLIAKAQRDPLLRELVAGGRA